MLQLKEHHFNGQYLKSFPKGVVVVVFKTNWCSFCQRLRPELTKLANILSDKVVIANVDCDESSNLIQRNNKFLHGYKVEYFPTIIIYKDGYMVSEYNGERNADHISKEVMNFL